MGQEGANEQPPPPPPTLWQVIGERIKNTPGSGLAFAVIPLLILGYLGWYYYGAKQLDRTLYALKLEKIEITPQPAWIHSDLKAEVYRQNGLSKLSLLEPSATATIAHAFEANVCIKSTNHVRKLSGGKVQIDVTYRQPAAYVYVQLPLAPGASKREAGAYPIDDEGVVLPSTEFAQSQLGNYFMIFAKDIQLERKDNVSFRDPRIGEALALCKLLEPVRSELQLAFIDVFADGMDVQLEGFNSWQLRIRTKDERAIIWGHAPGKETKDEMLVEEKIATMKAWLAAPPSAGSVEELDLRQRRGLGQRFTSAANQALLNPSAPSAATSPRPMQPIQAFPNPTISNPPPSSPILSNRPLNQTNP